MDEAREARQQCRLAGAVRAHYRDDLARVHVQRHVVEDRHVAIPGIERLRFEEGVHRSGYLDADWLDTGHPASRE
jgi:hypothetical protein